MCVCVCVKRNKREKGTYLNYRAIAFQLPNHAFLVRYDIREHQILIEAVVVECVDVCTCMYCVCSRRVVVLLTVVIHLVKVILRLLRLAFYMCLLLALSM